MLTFQENINPKTKAPTTLMHVVQIMWSYWFCGWEF